MILNTRVEEENINEEKKPLIISTDPGIDDIAAMTISLFAKKLDVRMIVRLGATSRLNIHCRTRLI